jgi:hypothetical protein
MALWQALRKRYGRSARQAGCMNVRKILLISISYIESKAAPGDPGLIVPKL